MGSEAGSCLTLPGSPGADFTRLAGELEAGLDVLTAGIDARLRESLPDWMAETVFAEEEIVRFIRASLAAQLLGFRTGALPEHPSDVDAVGAQAAAQVGELKLLLSGYRIAQKSLWDAWLELVESSVGDTAERRRLLRHGSDYFFRYTSAVSDHVSEIYQRQVEQSVRSGEQRRFEAIRSLLRGEPLAGVQLDVELEQHHLGLVAWGPQAEEAARELAAALGRRLVAIGPLNHDWWCWISGARPLAPGQERDLGRFAPAGDARLAVGLEGYGEAGFRASNRQALRARRVGRGGDRPVVRYTDVAVEALASESGEDARAFVAHELRGIEDDSTASQRIRETLAAYFAADHNAASAAAALGIHHQTVANRLRAAEERLGHPISARRLELETALRLRASLQREAGGVS
jgi:hypothetical protein